MRQEACCRYGGVAAETSSASMTDNDEFPVDCPLDRLAEKTPRPPPVRPSSTDETARLMNLLPHAGAAIADLTANKEECQLYLQHELDMAKLQLQNAEAKAAEA